MAEMIEMKEGPLWPRPLGFGPVRGPVPRPVRYLIDPTAFAGAIVAAPLLITALTFWIGFIPVISLAMGGPVYLLCAVPVLMWELPRREPTFKRLALMGFAAAMAVAALMFAITMMAAQQSFVFLAALYAIMGAIFGPLWAGTIAPLYLKFRRAEYARAIV